MRISSTFPLIAAVLIFMAGCGDDVFVSGGTNGDSTPLKAEAVSAGDQHTCAVASGAVKCWGFNSSGQLGNDNNFTSLTPVNVSGITTATRVSAGGAHTCALLSDGTIRCWGNNTDGQLGDNTNNSSNVPVTVSGITGAVAVSAGGDHTCALLSNNTIKCWGRNASGQLGTGLFTDRSFTPVTVINISNAVEVSSGNSHTCARLANGIRCWGLNSIGQLGNTSLVNSPTPIAPTNALNADFISAGRNHTCTVTNAGTVQCWGNNATGQLGNLWTLLSTIPPSSLTFSTSPVTTASLTGGTHVSVGLSHTCARVSGGAVRCWGDETFGQLGIFSQGGLIPPGPGAPSTSTYLPVTVNSISTAVSIDAGQLHTCALLSDTSVVCWGRNDFGQLGNGTGIDSLIPVEVLL